MIWGRRVGQWVAGALAACLPAGLAARTSAATPLGGGGALDISLGRVVLSLVVCVIIAVLAILLVRQRGGRMDIAAAFARIERRPARIRVIETRRLSPHADVSLIAHDGREYLLVLQQGSTLVLREEQPQAVEDTPCA